MEIVLVRHAQPAWSRDDATAIDPGLTPLGRRQAMLVAERINRLAPTELLVSPARRSRETAAAISDRIDLDPVTLDWLHEIHLPGHWEGSPSEEVTRVLRESRFRPRDDWWEGLAGGESFRDFHARICTGLEATLDERGVKRSTDDPDHLWHASGEEGGRVVIVAHAGTNSLILGFLLGLEPEPWEWERFASSHASVSVLTAVPIAGAHIFSLRRFSDVSHFPPDLVTA